MSPAGAISAIILVWAVAMTSAVPLQSYAGGRRLYADLQREYAQTAGYAHGRQLAELQSPYEAQAEEYGRQYAELQVPNAAPYRPYADLQEYGAKANGYPEHNVVENEQKGNFICCRLQLPCCH